MNDGQGQRAGGGGDGGGGGGDNGSAADAEDLVQDIFLQVYRRLDTFRGEAALGTWLPKVLVGN